MHSTNHTGSLQSCTHRGQQYRGEQREQIQRNQGLVRYQERLDRPPTDRYLRRHQVDITSEVSFLTKVEAAGLACLCASAEVIHFLEILNNQSAERASQGQRFQTHQDPSQEEANEPLELYSGSNETEIRRDYHECGFTYHPDSNSTQDELIQSNNTDERLLPRGSFRQRENQNSSGSAHPIANNTMSEISPKQTIQRLFEKASKGLSLALDSNLSPEKIEDALLGKLMACDPDPRYQDASLLLTYGKCGDGVSEETTEAVRKLLSLICQSRLSTVCSEDKFSSKEAFETSLHAQMEDFTRIDQRFMEDHCEANFRALKIWRHPEVISMARNLLSLQRNLSKTHYLFSHGMGRISFQYSRIIGEIDHCLWPQRNSQGFIFARAVPPNMPEIPLNETIRKIIDEGLDDQQLRTELLGADVDLLNSELAESALFFYSANSNIYRDFLSITSNILRTFAEPFDINFSEIPPQLERDIITLTEAVKIFDKSKGNGSLLVYTVPKPIIQNASTNFVYLAQPFGIPIGHGDRDYLGFDAPDVVRNYLDEMQTSWTLWDKMQTGREIFPGMSISVRILTSHLRPENGIKSFWLGEHAQSESEEEQIVAQRIAALADNFFKMVVQHCRSLRATQTNQPNAECEQLLSTIHEE